MSAEDRVQALLSLFREAHGRSLRARLRAITEADARALNVDRVSVWVFADGKSAIRCLDLFELASGVHSSGIEIPAARCPGYVRALETTEVVAVEDALSDPRTRELARDYLIPQRVYSLLDAPLFSNDGLAGALCHERVGARRGWSPGEREFAAGMAHLAALALECRSRERVMRRLEDAVRELARANEELREFAAFASHDLQAPLRRIGSFAEMLSDRVLESLDPEARGQLDAIRRGARDARELVRMLLAYLHAGNGGRRAVIVDLDPVLDEVLEEFGPDLRKTGVRVFRDRLPSVRADRAELKQVLWNLIDNAVKFRAPRRRARILVRARRVDDGWEIVVRDNGIGFDPRWTSEVFRPFRRLHAARRYAGRGIGMAITRKIVERRGGRIWADARPGRGAAFRVTLPSVEKAAGARRS